MRTLFLLLVIGAALGGASYAGARFTGGKLVGPTPTTLGPLTTRFAFSGVPNLPAKPRAWVLAYPNATGFGRGGAEIYVSVTGELLGTRPKDLGARLEALQPVEP
ncbi:MAG: hypothetical protein ABI037_10555 [Gemmatimonadales bacterium]